LGSTGVNIDNAFLRPTQSPSVPLHTESLGSMANEKPAPRSFLSSFPPPLGLLLQRMSDSTCAEMLSAPRLNAMSLSKVTT